MKVVVSLGKSALCDPEIHKSSGELFCCIHNAAVSIHTLLDAGHNVVVMFGHEQTLDADLQSLQHDDLVSFDKQEVLRQGLVGYLIEQVLRNTSNAKRHFVTVVTHVLVDGDDRAFTRSSDSATSVCVGRTVDESTARRWEQERSWTVTSCAQGFRRAVPKPSPICLLQTESIKHLARAGIFTVLCSGSGVVVKRDLQNQVTGMAALVDQNKTAAILARDVDADALLLLTDVSGVYEQWDTPEKSLLSTLHLNDIDKHVAKDSGMRSKVEAAGWFTQYGEIAAIGPVSSAMDVLNGFSGTRLLS